MNFKTQLQNNCSFMGSIFKRFAPLFLLTASTTLVSCAAVSKRMPATLEQMHGLLTTEHPGQCGVYHYNFERQTPRLYSEKQIDSIYNIIDFLKIQCGPTSNLEITQLLLLLEQRRYDDSLVGSMTVPQMLWYRSEEEYLFNWRKWSYIYGSPEFSDNTHERFLEFRSALAKNAATDSISAPAGRAIGLLYSGSFDSSFTLIQSKEMRGTKLGNCYEDYVVRVKNMFPARGNIALFSGSWRPQGNNRFLGNHPEIGIQFGSEWKSWRADGVISYRFSSAKDSFLVDSLGQIVATNTFNSWLFGIEGGFKFVDFSRFSSDLFVGIGYDVIFSVSLAGDPNSLKSHKSLGASAGLRTRYFLDKSSGWYIGGIMRYSLVDYGNKGGTDLSGNALSISLVTGFSLHETLHQFLKKLNYKGNWRE
jgi:hypothetical protein